MFVFAICSLMVGCCGVLLPGCCVFGVLWVCVFELLRFGLGSVVV